jgi:3'-phosphoadenosine 5'-phosphosulfate sulfotransferase (PAPS reductase)/FAD synthetase
VIALSGGLASWAAGRRTVNTYGTADTAAVFTDVKGADGNPHTGEHPDTYRFVRDAAADLDVPLTWLQDGRDIWDVFLEHGQLGNDYRAHCSVDLKVLPMRRWLDEHRSPVDTLIVMGLDWTETHRLAAVYRGYAHTIDGCVGRCGSLFDSDGRLEGPGCKNLLWATPWRVWMPLLDKPRLTKWQLKDLAAERNLTPSEMYREGFAHANCIFCVKGGKAHGARVVRLHPKVWAHAERREDEFRASRPGREKYTVMNDGYEILPDNTRRKIPLTLREFRARIQAADAGALPFDEFDEGGCGCFTDLPGPGAA